MPGIKVRISTEEAQTATKKLIEDLNKLGATTKLTEQEVSKLKERLLDKMGADRASDAVDRLAKSVGMTKQEVDKFNQSIGNIGKQANAFETMKAHWLGISVAIAGAYMAFNKVKGIITDVAMAGARYETLGVVMTVVGKNARYSASQMESFSKALQEQGISMMESRQSIVRMAQAQLDLTKSSQLARIAQDAAVIGQINSSEAFQRMIYGIQSGQTEVLKTIGINVTFEQGYEKMAKTLGKNSAQLTENEKALSRQNQVLEYGPRIAGVYEAAMDTAGKQVASFTRYIEDFKVKMGEAFNPATAELVKSATIAMKSLQDEISKPEAQIALANLSKEVSALIISVGKELPSALKSTVDALNILLGVYNSLPEGTVGAVGVGIIGKMLFGSGPVGWIAGTLYLISAQVKSMDWAKAQTASSKADIEKAYKENEELLQKIKLQIASIWAPKGKSMSPAEDRLEPMIPAEDRMEPILKGKAEATTETMKKIKAETAKMFLEVDQMGKSQWEKDVLRMKSEVKEYQDLGVDKKTIDLFIFASTLKINQEKAEEEKKNYLDTVELIAKLAKITEDQTEKDLKAIADIEKANLESAQKRGDAAAKEYNEIAKLEKEKQDQYIKDQEDYEKLVTSQADFGMTENERAINKIVADYQGKVNTLNGIQEKGNITYKQYMDAMVLLDAEKNAAILQQTSTNLQNIASFYSQIEGYEAKYREKQFAWIDAEAKLRKEKYGDNIAAAKWADQEKRKIDIAQGKDGKDFFEGMKAGYKEMEDDSVKFGKYGYEAFRSFSESSRTAVSTILFDSIKKGSFDAKAVFETFTDSLLKTFTDILSKMVLEAAAKDIVMLFQGKWSSDSSSILGIINKGWGLVSYLTGSGSDYTTPSYDQLGGMAKGGYYPGEKPVWVGEEGAELLFQKQPGYVMNHKDSMAYAARYGGYIKGFEEGGDTGEGDPGGSGSDPEGIGGDSWDAPKSYVQMMAEYKIWAKNAGVYTSKLESAAQAYMKTSGYTQAVELAYLQSLMGGKVSVPSNKIHSYYNAIVSRLGKNEEGWDIARGMINPYVYSARYEGANDYVTRWRDGTVKHNYYDDSPSAFETYFPMVVKAALAAAAAYVATGLYAMYAAAGTAGGAGAGAGEMATYGMGGSGLSGTGAYGATALGVSEIGTLSWTDGLIQLAQDYGTSFLKRLAIDNIIKLVGQNLASGEQNEGGASFSFLGAEGDMSGIAKLMGQVPPNESVGFNLAGYANGGRYKAKEPFWAGEKGREIVFPDGPGQVLSHEDSLKYAKRRSVNLGYADGTYTLPGPIDLHPMEGGGDPLPITITINIPTPEEVPVGPRVSKAVNPADYGNDTTQSAYDIALKQRQMDIQAMELQGNKQAALTATREDELILLDASLQEQAKEIYALQDRNTTLALNATAEQKEIDLIKLQGGTLEASQRQREVEIESRDKELAGMSESDAAIQRRIYSLDDEITAIDKANEKKDLEIELMDASGNAHGVLIAQREAELKALDENLRPLKEQIYAQQDLNKTNDLNNRLLTAQGLSTQLLAKSRQKEIDAASETDQAILKQIYAQEDLNKINDLNVRLLEAQGKEGDVLAITRQKELDAASEAEKAILKQIYAQEDLNDANEAAAAAAKEAATAWKASMDQYQDLFIQWAKATGDDQLAAMAKALERQKVLNDYNGNIFLITLQEAIWGLEDSAEAAAKAMEIANRTQSLQIELLRAQGDEEGALAKEREIALAGLDNDEQRQLQKDIWTLTDAAEALAEAAEKQEAAFTRYQGLVLGVLQAGGDLESIIGHPIPQMKDAKTWERTLIMDDLIKAGATSLDKALQEEIWRMEDLKEATELANEKYDMQLDLLDKLGFAEEVLAVQRMKELDAMDESLKKTQLQIWAVEELNDTIEKFKARAEEISSFISDMARSDLAPVGSAAAWDAEYTKKREAAMAPEASDASISAYLAYSKEYLAWQKSYGSEGTYKSIYDSIMRDVLSLGDNAEKNIDAAQRQLDAIKEQTIEIQSAARRQETLLRELIAGVMGLSADHVGEERNNKNFADGGISTGPTSGYRARLHGTELIVSQNNDYPATVQNDRNNIILIEELRKIRKAIEDKDTDKAVILDSAEVGRFITKEVDNNRDLRKSIKKVNANG